MIVQIDSFIAVDPDRVVGVGSNDGVTEIFAAAGNGPIVKLKTGLDVTTVIRKLRGEIHE